jgi:hypothetical protein
MIKCLSNTISLYSLNENALLLSKFLIKHKKWNLGCYIKNNSTPNSLSGLVPLHGETHSCMHKYGMKRLHAYI